MTGERRSSHASAICDGVAPWRFAIWAISAGPLALPSRRFTDWRTPVRATSPACSGYHGMNAIRSRVAVIDDRLPFAIDEVEAVLHRHDREKPLRALNLLDADFRQPDVPDLALALRLLQKSELVVLGHGGVDAVQLIEVDAFEAQPPQASVERLAEALGTAVRLPLVRTRPIEAALGGDDEARGIRMQRLRRSALR